MRRFPSRLSLYGASKLACEGLIAAYAEGYGMRGYIFRFVSILGERYTHGHVFDFVQKLAADPSSLHILGNGLQRKSYLHVRDCIDAMLSGSSALMARSTSSISAVTNIARCDSPPAGSRFGSGSRPRFTYAGGDRGWIGDVPFIFLDTGRIRALGWRPKLSIPRIH